MTHEYDPRTDEIGRIVSEKVALQLCRRVALYGMEACTFKVPDCVTSCAINRFYKTI